MKYTEKSWRVEKRGILYRVDRKYGGGEGREWREFSDRLLHPLGVVLIERFLWQGGGAQTHLEAIHETRTIRRRYKRWYSDRYIKTLANRFLEDLNK